MEESYLTVSDVTNYLKISRSGAYGAYMSQRLSGLPCRWSIRVPESLFLKMVKKHTTILACVSQNWPNATVCPYGIPLLRNTMRGWNFTEVRIRKRHKSKII